MAEFAYNNTKNASTSHTPFKLNYGYYLRVAFEENMDSQPKSCSADELTEELRELIEVCCQNFLHVQELQKRAHDKRVKSCSYTLDQKGWLNRKYIKTKWNKKLKNKFFGSFRVFYAVGKQVYKLELLTKWKIYNEFHLLLLEWDITKKRQIDKALPKPEKELELEARGNKEYEVKVIIDSTVYDQQANNQIPGPYYLVLQKGYSEEENT